MLSESIEVDTFSDVLKAELDHININNRIPVQDDDLFAGTKKRMKSFQSFGLEILINM